MICRHVYRSFCLDICLRNDQVQGNNPVEDLKLLFGTFGSLMRGQALAPPDVTFSNPVESLKRL